MQNKTNKRLIVICLLLCTLFFTNYASALSISGMNTSSATVQDIFSKIEGSSPFSMDGGITYNHSDSITKTDISEKISIFSSRQSRWLSTKTNFAFSTSKDTVQLMSPLYTSKLSDEAYSQLSSNIIVNYLHKKDGMK